MDLGALMQQARKMQEHLAGVQEELGRRTVEASAGGGMVTVTANGRQEIVSIVIAPELAAADDRLMLQDLVTAAVNAALRSSRELMQAELAKVTGGLRIPGLSL